MRRAWIVLGMVLVCGTGRAEWAPLSQTLSEIDLSHAAVDPHTPDIMFASGEKAVFRTEDRAKNWKKVLAVAGDDSRIHCIYIDPTDSRRVYVCSEKGLHASSDGGRRWKLVFRGRQEGRKGVHAVARRPSGAPSLWIASAGGLLRRDERTGEIIKVEGLPDIAVYSIVFPKEDKSDIVIATEKGIYKSPDGMGRWERVGSAGARQEEKAETNLEQFEIEEYLTPPAFSNLVYWPAQDKLLAASTEGLLEAKADASAWTSIRGENLPDKKINSVAGAANTFYIATDKGVFRRDPELEKFVSVSDGLESREVREIIYDAHKDALIAVTPKGLFRWQSPEYPVLTTPGIAKETQSVDVILNRFNAEPSISDVQKAAIQYAEVHPDKINAWRTAAARKALLPTVSLHTSEDTNQNIDIDRGGTADPDRFINGPEERSNDWYVTASWDLGDLIWNDDQTSIDTRSRLMVELRDDILNEVTHLYYERRRLQIEMVLSPAKDLPLKLEKEIRLAELTAGIDGLTGGYFSRNLEALRG